MFAWVLYWHNDFNKAMVAFVQLLPDFVSGFFVWLKDIVLEISLKLFEKSAQPYQGKVFTKHFLGQT